MALNSDKFKIFSIGIELSLYQTVSCFGNHEEENLEKKMGKGENSCN